MCMYEKICPPFRFLLSLSLFLFINLRLANISYLAIILFCTLTLGKS